MFRTFPCSTSFLKPATTFALSSFGALAFMVSLSLLTTSSVHATMAELPTTTTLSVISADGSQNFDVSEAGDNSWKNIVHDYTPNFLCTEANYNELISALDDGAGSYSVTQLTPDGNTQANSIDWDLSVWIMYTPYSVQNSVLSSDWGDTTLAVQYNYNVSFAHLMVNNDGSYRLQCRPATGSGYSSPLFWSSFIAGGVDPSATPYGYLYYSNFSLTYPSDYEGGTLPGTAPAAEPDPVAYVPDFNVVTATGYQLVVQDLNFNTFDDVLFTCDSETTPIIHYELWKGSDPLTDTLIDSGVFSPTVAYTKTLPPEANSYVLIGWYDCGEDDLTFSDSTFLNFELNAYGGLVLGCATDSFEGFVCSMGGTTQIGVISTTLNGLIGIVNSVKAIDPTYCNTNWTSTINFQDEYIGVQNIPQEICDNVEAIYLSPSASFHTVAVWVNVVMSGTAVLFLVFGLLAILGFKVRLVSPIGEGDTNVSPSGSGPSTPYRVRETTMTEVNRGKSTTHVLVAPHTWKRRR